MNKAIILQALRYQLHTEEDNLIYDKAEAAALWDRCDKSRPVETYSYYEYYKMYKNRIRATQSRLKRIRATIRAVKCL